MASTLIACPPLNQVKAGQSIPVKFSLSGNQGLNILASGSPTSQAFACASSAPVDDKEQLGHLSQFFASPPAIDRYQIVVQLVA